MSQTIKFSDVKDKLLDKLKEKQSKNELNLPESVTLLEGIFNQPIFEQLTGSFVIGGPSVPMVALIGKSGRLYFFALKALLPEEGV